MLSKIYFPFFVIGFIGSVISIVHSFMNVEKLIWCRSQIWGPLLLSTSFSGIILSQFNAIEIVINFPVSLIMGIFFTYYAQGLFNSSIPENERPNL